MYYEYDCKLALATSAAALFSSALIAPVYAGEVDGATEVKCQGINSCKGTRPGGCLAPIADLLARVYIAKVFFDSGWSKITDWKTTLYLFQHEYSVPLMSPEVAAWMGTGGELVLATQKKQWFNLQMLCLFFSKMS